MIPLTLRACSLTFGPFLAITIIGAIILIMRLSKKNNNNNNFDRVQICGATMMVGGIVIMWVLLNFQTPIGDVWLVKSGQPGERVPDALWSPVAWQQYTNGGMVLTKTSPYFWTVYSYSCPGVCVNVGVTNIDDELLLEKKTGEDRTNLVRALEGITHETLPKYLWMDSSGINNYTSNEEGLTADLRSNGITYFGMGIIVKP